MKKKKMGFNVDLLLRVRQHILEEPPRVNMAAGIVAREDGADFNLFDGERVHFGSCGTAACIAGWGVLLSGLAHLLPLDWPDIEVLSSKAFRADYRVLRPLFLKSLWEFDLRHEYSEAAERGDWKTCAEVVARRIDQFLDDYQEKMKGVLVRG
jgi:hypothetical protein